MRYEGLHITRSSLKNNLALNRIAISVKSLVFLMIRDHFLHHKVPEISLAEVILQGAPLSAGKKPRCDAG